MLDIRSHQQADLGVIKLKGRFDFAGHRYFKEAYQPLIEKKFRGIDIDLSEVDYLDSAALGMLLLLQERAAAVGAGVRLLGARGIVKDILGVAHFERFFEMDERA